MYYVMVVTHSADPMEQELKGGLVPYSVGLVIIG